MATLTYRDCPECSQSKVMEVWDDACESCRQEAADAKERNRIASEVFQEGDEATAAYDAMPMPVPQPIVVEGSDLPPPTVVDFAVFDQFPSPNWPFDRESWLSDAQVDAMPMPQPGGHPAFHDNLRTVAAMHGRKSRVYGTPADPLANITEAADCGIEPWQAAFYEANSAMRRVKSIISGERLNEPGTPDDIRNALLDGMSFLNISAVKYEEMLAACPLANQTKERP